MRVMGLERMLLVAPHCKVASEARARASGAVDVLDNARIVATLDEALADARCVIGTSARSRQRGPEMQSVRAGVKEFAGELRRGEVAIVFGPERTGLDNAALARCNRLWQIPTAQDYASLNLAAAVQVVAYEIFHARGGNTAAAPLPEVAPAGDVAGLMVHFDRVARTVGFIARNAPDSALNRVERLFRRVCLEPAEVKLLRGFLSAVEGKKRRSNEQ